MLPALVSLFDHNRSIIPRLVKLLDITTLAEDDIDLLSLSDEEFIKRVRTPLLIKAEKEGKLHLFPKLLFLYDKELDTKEKEEYLSRLSLNQKNILSLLQSPHPVYSVYLRKPPYKMLMLLKPHTREVSFTFAGLKVFKLAKDKLPSYTMIVSIVTIKKDEFIITPYIKGRSEEEIATLVRQNPPIDTSMIVDIDVSEFNCYTGQYGKHEQVVNYLSKLGLQSPIHIPLTYIPNTSEFYPLLKDLPEGEKYGDNYILEGKNNIILYQVPFSTIINNKGKSIYLLTITDSYISALEAGRNRAVGYSLVLTIDDTELEVFDPNGPDVRTNSVYNWVNKLLEEYRMIDESKMRILTVDTPFLPQTISQQGEEQCIVWCYWYIWLQVHNPNIERIVLQQYMQELHPNVTLDKMCRLSTMLYS